jgi:hypothetical protein
MESFKEYFEGSHMFKSTEVVGDALRIVMSEDSIDTILESVDFENILAEATMSDLVRNVDSGSKKRAAKVDYKFKEMKDGGLLVFQTTSGTRNDNDMWYTQYIRLVAFDEVMDGNEDASLQDKVRLLLQEPIEVYCDCPAFLYYGFAYMGSILDYKYGKDEDRKPVKRNPKEEGSVCKHLYRILKRWSMQSSRVVGALSKRIAQDMESSGAGAQDREDLSDREKAFSNDGAERDQNVKRNAEDDEEAKANKTAQDRVSQQERRAERKAEIEKEKRKAERDKALADRQEP